MISASSFCIRFAEVPKAFDIFGLGLGSLRVSSLVVAAAAAADDEPPPAEFGVPVAEPEAGMEPGCKVLPLRPRATAAAGFAVVLLVADILLAVPGGVELAARPTVGVFDDDPVLLVVAVPPLVVADDDIVGSQNKLERKFAVTYATPRYLK